MTLDLDAVARSLVTGSSSAEVAAEAVRSCDQLVAHLSRVIGGLGVRTLLTRSFVLVSARSPWLAVGALGADVTNESWAELRAAILRQDPETARAGVADLLTTFVGLLARLIGDGLVARLLHDVWPAQVSKAAKETT